MSRITIYVGQGYDQQHQPTPKYLAGEVQEAIDQFEPGTELVLVPTNMMVSFSGKWNRAELGERVVAEMKEGRTVCLSPLARITDP